VFVTHPLLAAALLIVALIVALGALCGTGVPAIESNHEAE
jgi:hypothetical protein